MGTIILRRGKRYGIRIIIPPLRVCGVVAGAQRFMLPTAPPPTDTSNPSYPLVMPLQDAFCHCHDCNVRRQCELHTSIIQPSMLRPHSPAHINDFPCPCTMPLEDNRTTYGGNVGFMQVQSSILRPQSPAHANDLPRVTDSLSVKARQGYSALARLPLISNPPSMSTYNAH